MTEQPYDSRFDTLAHSRRVGELVGQVIKELVDRSTQHDLSKTEGIEREAFDRMTPKLAGLTYGTDEYKSSLRELGPALQHHYAANRHHPEHHKLGVADMTLIDVIEMLADWKAAGERHNDGDLERSIEINEQRFGMDYHLTCLLLNTARELGWLTHDRDEVQEVDPV